jgi:2-polyprenyl-6-methoxyphenol hydroxylase-like FAD-dependent oxidoreductase
VTVLIAGAGIGGLSLALSLHQAGIPCQVFESVAALKPLGVGINLQPHAVRELSELGLLPALDAMAIRLQEVSYRSSHGKLIWTEPRGKAAGYDWPQFSAHRGKLQMLLFATVRERLGDGAVSCGHTVMNSSDTTSGVAVSLRRPDGSIEVVKGSVLIAADGIHSALRAAHYPDEGPPAWGGTVMWRGVTHGPSFLSGTTMAMSGCKARKFVCYPIGIHGGGSIINWIADLSFPSDYLWNREDWNRPGRLDDFLPEFTDWHFDWLDVPAIIKGASDVYEYPMVDREPVDRWTFGNMTLLGDAAHAMYPIGSNGASQAILDARVLTRALLQYGVGSEALAAYEADRRPPTSAIVLANRGDGPDKILDEVESRAPQGFDDIESVMTRRELEDTAAVYKRLAGMDVETLNARPSIVQL